MLSSFSLDDLDRKKLNVENMTNQNKCYKTIADGIDNPNRNSLKLTECTKKQLQLSVILNGPTKNRKGLKPPKRTEKNFRVPKRNPTCHF